MIELKNVSKTYKQKKSSDVKALDDVSIKFSGIGLTFIIGPSGSGKSTLLNVIGSLDKIDNGEIIVDSLEISKLEEKELNLYRNNHIGFIFQDYNLLPDYNVHDNIDIALELQGKSDDKKINDILTSVGLKDLNLRKVDELSGGEKQRVAIARALVKEPKIILADEPTGNLDSKTSIEIMEILKGISDNCEVIVVSHNKELAKRFATRIIEIRDGKIIKDTGLKGKDKKYEINNLSKDISYKKLFKLSLTNLINSRKKTFFSIILLAMTLMFMAFCLNIKIYDAKSDAINTLKKNKEYFLNISKYAIIEDGGFLPLEMDDEDIDKLSDILSYKANPVYTLKDNGKPLNFTYEKEFWTSQFYEEYFMKFEEILNEEMIGEYIGNIPTNSREIMITNHRAEAFMKYGVMLSDETFYYPSSIEKILEEKKPIKLGNDTVTVVGIVMNDNHQYDTFKENEIFDTPELSHFYSLYGIQNEYVFVKDFTKDATVAATDKKSVMENGRIDIDYKNGSSSLKIEIDDEEVSYYNSNLELVSGIVKDKNIIIPISFIKNMDKTFNDDFFEFRSKNPTLDYDEAFDLYIPGYLEKNKEIFKSRAITMVGYDSKGKNKWIALNIVGISLDERSHVSSDIYNYAILNKEIKLEELNVYLKDEKRLDEILNKLGIVNVEKNENSPYYISFRYLNAVYENDSLYDDFKWLISGVLVVSSILSLIMLYNLIKTTINDSKVKIGTLKALGMNNKCSLLIFIFEYIIIDIISWIIGIILWNYLSDAFNIDFFANPYLVHNFIIKEPIILLYVLLYVGILSFIALITIMKKINNIKPIDSILKRETK